MAGLGHFRESVVLKGTKKEPDSAPPLANSASGVGPGDDPSPGVGQSGMENGGEGMAPASPKASKQVDHYGFTFSMSKADEH